MANTIITKNSSTASAVPTSGDLVQGELAVNVTDKRLFTENSGGTVVELGVNPTSITTGNLTATGTVTIPDNAISGDKVEGGTINAVTINTLTAGQANFADNAKAIFGAGSDLQIYHDGSNSYIVDAGTGGLYLNAASQLRMQSFAGEDYIICQNNADVRLFYDNAEKLATTSTGIDVAGTVVSDGLTVSGDASISGTVPKLVLKETDTTDVNTMLRNSGGVFGVRTLNDAETAAYDRLTIDHATGDISFYEDTGTTPKFFWDASAESLGIGTTSPSSMWSQANRLVVGGGATNEGIAIYSSSTGNSRLAFVDTLTSTSGLTDGGLISYDHTNNKFLFKVTGTDRLTIDSAGDLLVKTADARIGSDTGSVEYGTSTNNSVRFYTSDIERLRIDGSSGNVGIGTSSPTNGKVEIQTSATTAGLWVQTGGTSSSYTIAEFRTGANAPALVVKGNNRVGIGGVTSPNGALHVGGNSIISNGYFFSIGSASGFSPELSEASNGWVFDTNGSERMRLDSAGNLGLGVTPSAWINTRVVLQNKNSSFFTSTTNANYTAIGANVYRNASNVNTYIASSYASMYTQDDSNHVWYTAPSGTAGSAISFTQAMTLDSSGNLLVGKTVTAETTQGVRISETGQVIPSKTSGPCIVATRLGTDGEIQRFTKDGTTVGSIGSAATGKLYIGSPDGSGGFLRFESNIVSPCSSTGGVRDNVIDLGKIDSRFDDIYATNGTIQTSDRNEKQDIETLSEAETRVAVACKGLLRKFRWKDAVAEKGDEARIHFGIIAQDLQAAFAAEGLDAGRYAMFISSTWTDEETGEERTRLGVRYPELLAFIIAAI